MRSTFWIALPGAFNRFTVSLQAALTALATR
jgi:hypothetical protein